MWESLVLSTVIYAVLPLTVYYTLLVMPQRRAALAMSAAGMLAALGWLGMQLYDAPSRGHVDLGPNMRAALGGVFAAVFGLAGLLQASGGALWLRAQGRFAVVLSILPAALVVIGAGVLSFPFGGSLAD